MEKKDEKATINCPKCNKLLAKIDRNGSCNNIYLYCKCCKKEYRFTIEKVKKSLEPSSN